MPSYNKKKNKASQELSKPKNHSFDFDLISQYSELKPQKNDNRLHDESLKDLDFHAFFKHIDRTYSAVGQQMLYHQLLHQRLTLEQLQDQESLVDHYSSLDNRKKSQSILSKLSKGNDYYFPYLMFSELPERMFPSYLVLILQFSMILGALLMIKYPAFFLLVILLFAINLYLHYIHKSRIGNFVTYYSRLSSLSATFKKLIPYAPYSSEEQSRLISDAKHIDKITSNILFLKTDNLQNSEFGSVLWFVFEIIKIITLGEITVFNKLIDKIYASRQPIQNVYKAIGKIDIAISINILRESLPYYSIPTFLSDSKSLKIKSLYHPLIKDCTPNDIELKNKSLLLTGSNMAGKSSFIKAINLNCLTAQTLNTSFSLDYAAPLYHIITSMNVKDNIIENRSYYMEEVNAIGNLIKCSDADDKSYLISIDEIFKGTNTIERISSAKSILEYLNKKQHLVLVSTHDIELTKLLQDGYDLYYFQESISDRSLSFDYKIKKGSLERSNAINILEIAGYPKSIIEESRKLASRIQKEKTGDDNL